MPADLRELEAMIEAALPGAEVAVVDETGAGDHLRATVRAPQFEGLSRIDQHRLVKAAVKSRFDDGTIHALTIRIPPPSPASAPAPEPDRDAHPPPRSEGGG
jgi:stress-induced morphogen